MYLQVPTQLAVLKVNMLQKEQVSAVMRGVCDRLLLIYLDKNVHSVAVSFTLLLSRELKPPLQFNARVSSLITSTAVDSGT